MIADHMTPEPLWPGYVLGLAPGVRAESGSHRLAFIRDRGILSLNSMSPSCAAALRELPSGALTPQRIRQATAGTALDRIALTVTLDELDVCGWLSYAAGDPPQLIAWRRCQACGPGRRASSDDHGSRRRYRMSRFCHIVPREGELVAVSPVRGFEVAVRDSRLWGLLQRLARPASLSDLCDEDEDGGEDLIRSCWPLLLDSGVIVPLTRNADVCEAEPGSGGTADPLRYWEQHDLLFHTESREGFHGKPFGGTYRFGGQQPEPSPRPPAAGVLPLAVPSPADLPPGHLFRVLDQRRSVRKAGGRPCTAGQLGEFMYRSARTTASLDTDHGLVHTRPYPSGGAIHELNLHLIVNRVTGIPAGLYRYQPAEHWLERHGMPVEATARLLAGSAWATLRTEPPDVLIVITAELPRLAWKYEAIAYSLVLKHVGALLQTMYLVATAMGLAPCAVGGGDSREFARVTGIDPFAEPAVGEFTLGSAPDDDPRIRDE